MKRNTPLIEDDRAKREKSNKKKQVKANEVQLSLEWL